MAAIHFFGVTNWLYTTRQSDEGVQTSHWCLACFFNRELVNRGRDRLTMSKQNKSLFRSVVYRHKSWSQSRPATQRLIHIPLSHPLTIYSPRYQVGWLGMNILSDPSPSPIPPSMNAGGASLPIETGRWKKERRSHEGDANCCAASNTNNVKRCPEMGSPEIKIISLMLF